MLYYLVDSSEADRRVYRTKLMDRLEYTQEQEKCEINGGGEFMWLPASEEMAALPKDKPFQHILLEVKL